MEDKYTQILEGLITKTKAKEANWQKSDANSFILEFNNTKLKITDINDCYYIMFYNSNNVEINTLRSIVYPSVEELYQLIYANYLQIDETLDSLLSQINTPGVIGNKKKSELPF